MRIADLDFIMVPEWLARPDGREPDDDHWISRWQRNISTASWLDTRDLSPPDALLSQCSENTRPTVIISHGHGIDVILNSTAELAKTSLVGGFIVAPVPTGDWLDPPSDSALPLGFPSVIIAPDDHPDLSVAAAQSLSDTIGSHYVAAGPTGRIDAASGQGPWPEGLLRLGWFLKRLSAH